MGDGLGAFSRSNANDNIDPRTCTCTHKCACAKTHRCTSMQPYANILPHSAYVTGSSSKDAITVSFMAFAVEENSGPGSVLTTTLATPRHVDAWKHVHSRYAQIHADVICAYCPYCAHITNKLHAYAHCFAHVRYALTTYILGYRRTLIPALPVSSIITLQQHNPSFGARRPFILMPVCCCIANPSRPSLGPRHCSTRWSTTPLCLSHDQVGDRMAIIYRFVMVMMTPSHPHCCK